ncbi:MAG: hypothetical protein CV088_16150 [Nitrospira sp. LK70]|nr:hypothetical protein [Nitrospira sp. LK70]
MLCFSLLVVSRQGLAAPSEEIIVQAKADDPHSGNVAAVVKAQKVAYALTETTNGCPVPATDVLGWPSTVLRECVYGVGPKTNRRTGYVVLADPRPEAIATWIETACARILPSETQCFQTVLECGRRNFGMMFPVSGNMIENMRGGLWKNYFFRNGMIVVIEGQPNGTTEQIPSDRQNELARMTEVKITRIPSGVTRFWRTMPKQFAARFPNEAIPHRLTTIQERQQWLNIVRAESRAALNEPSNRLLEAWIAAHPITVTMGICPKDEEL